MCLLTKQLLPRRATKPITVYKLVYKEHGMYFTPFMHKSIGIYGYIQAAGPLTGTPVNDPSMPRRMTHVSSGYIHAYRNLENAKSWCRFYNTNPAAHNYKIMECIIEPGTLYYKGYTEICARSLTTKGIVY